MVEIVSVSDIVEENGKTVRENNLEKQHGIPIGELVEIRGREEWPDWHGVRLYVIDHGRDCDGTPLYTLGPRRDGEPDRWELHGGFGEESLWAVVPPSLRGMP